MEISYEIRLNIDKFVDGCYCEKNLWCQIMFSTGPLNKPWTLSVDIISVLKQIIERAKMNKPETFIYIFFCSFVACFAWGMETGINSDSITSDSMSLTHRDEENEKKQANVLSTAFKKQPIKYYKKIRGISEMITSWVCTLKGTEYDVVGQVWGASDDHEIYFLLGQVRAQMDLEETLKTIKEFSAHYSEKYDKELAHIIEEKPDNVIFTTLNKEISALQNAGKEAQAHAAAGLWTAGKVYLPHPEIAAWVKDFTQQILQFPSPINDDQVAMVQALALLRKHTAKYFQASFKFSKPDEQNYAPLKTLLLLRNASAELGLQYVVVHGGKVSNYDRDRLKRDKIELNKYDLEWVTIAHNGALSWRKKTDSLNEFQKKQIGDSGWAKKTFRIYLERNGEKGKDKKNELSEKDIDLLYFVLNLEIMDQFFNFGNKGPELKEEGQWYMTHSNHIKSTIMTPEELEKTGILCREITFLQRNTEQELVPVSLGIVFIPGRGVYAMESRRLDPLDFDNWKQTRRFVSPLSLLVHLSKEHKKKNEGRKLILSKFMRNPSKVTL